MSYRCGIGGRLDVASAAHPTPTRWLANATRPSMLALPRLQSASLGINEDAKKR